MAKYKYICKICNVTSQNKSQHRKHRGTTEHKNKCKCFEIELENLTEEYLNIKYGTSNIKEIIKKI